MYFNKQKDEAYLDTLIEKYWFLTDEIKNKDIRKSRISNHLKLSSIKKYINRIAIKQTAKSFLQSFLLKVFIQAPLIKNCFYFFDTRFLISGL